MKNSIEKTEVMSIWRNTAALDIIKNNQQLNQTKDIKYLGSIFTEDGKTGREIEVRVQKANLVNYQIAPFWSIQAYQ